MFSVQDALKYINNRSVQELFIVTRQCDEEGYEDTPFVEVMRGGEFSIPPEEQKGVTELSFLQGGSYFVLIVDQDEVIFFAENEGGMDEDIVEVHHEEFSIDAD